MNCRCKYCSLPMSIGNICDVCKEVHEPSNTTAKWPPFDSITNSEEPKKQAETGHRNTFIPGPTSYPRKYVKTRYGYSGTLGSNVEARHNAYRRAK